VSWDPLFEVWEMVILCSGCWHGIKGWIPKVGGSSHHSFLKKEPHINEEGDKRKEL
jgi:hypothetical protein